MLRELERFPYRKVLRTIPPMPQSDARGFMGTAAALLLFAGPDWARYRPAKLYDYLASHRPVLAWGSCGEIAHVIKSLSAGAVIDEGDASGLEEILGDVVAGTLAVRDVAAVDRWLADYDRRRIAAALYARLDTLLPEAAAGEATRRRR